MWRMCNFLIYGGYVAFEGIFQISTVGHVRLPSLGCFNSALGPVAGISHSSDSGDRYEPDYESSTSPDDDAIPF